MNFATWNIDADQRVLATAVHAGHELRPEIAGAMILDAGHRLREEDPFTDELAAAVGSWVAVERSRFEVDLNRPVDTAVYRTPDECWGIDVWSGSALADPLVERSRWLHDRFYSDLAVVLDELVARHGGFVLYDVHSYNHRRHGPGAPPESPADNPTVNLGTGSLPDRWTPVADAFVESLRDHEVEGEPLDVRRNVKFEGRHVAAFVHERYGDVGCALAIEFKKIFMDEWTGVVDKPVLDTLGEALRGTIGPVEAAWSTAWR